MVRYHYKSSLNPRRRRHLRVRSRVRGTAERPRLNVYRSSAHIYAQVIDDDAGHTLVSASTLESNVVAQGDGSTKTDKAKAVGQIVGKRALDSGVESVVFDRGGYQYHGRVQAVAEGARESGLKF